MSVTFWRSFVRFSFERQAVSQKTLGYLFTISAVSFTGFEWARMTFAFGYSAIKIYSEVTVHKLLLQCSRHDCTEALQAALLTPHDCSLTIFPYYVLFLLPLRPLLFRRPVQLPLSDNGHHQKKSHFHHHHSLSKERRIYNTWK